METRFGGHQILIYLCPNHPNERWDVQMAGEKMICIPCEVLTLRTRNALLEKELEKIAYPIRHLQIEADKEGAQLNGSVAIQLSDNPSWLKGIARSALDAAKEGK